MIYVGGNLIFDLPIFVLECDDDEDDLDDDDDGSTVLVFAETA